ncbi:MAG: sugar phosphate isomerase/epimerase family protein [Elusimicrobiota bacterium]
MIMRLGRDFTNLLNTSFLTEEEKKLLKEGKIAVSDMDAKVQIKSKRDIINQIKVAKETGLDHVELDGGIPNPFLEMSAAEIRAGRDFSEKNGITLSLHIPYTFVCASTAAFQESDRVMAVEMIKKYLNVAGELGCNNVVMHPGAVPFYQTLGEYGKMVLRSVVKSLLEIVPLAEKKKLSFHLENNTAFDGVAFEIPECLEIIKEVNAKGHNVKFCFDIGHWFTRVDVNLKVHNPPESILNEIPNGIFSQVHLNDYIPVVKKFHPPLHYQKGLLKKENLVNLIRKLARKGASLIVVETAVREVDELLNARELMDAESKYLREVFKDAEV